jgi:hypothetical protein
VAVYRAASASDRTSVEMRVEVLVGMSLALVLWAVLSGVGGIGYQNFDYQKHNAILDSLVSSPWPVVGPGSEDTLVYFLSYYLPAASLGKVFGFQAAVAAQFVFNLVGLHLAAFWFWNFSKGPAVAVIAIFLLGSGLDVVGTLLYPGPFGIGEHLEWWTGIVQYSSQASLYFWVPQHALSAWIAVGLVLNEESRVGMGSYVLLLACCVLWSPFVSIGLLVLLPFVVTRRFPLEPFCLVAGVCVGVVTSAYILSSTQSTALMLSGLELEKYILFTGLEVGVFLPFMWRGDRTLLIPVVLMLLVLPALRLGAYNDLVMRASIPALFVMWLLVSRDAFVWGLRKKRVLVAILALGFATSLQEAVRGIRYFSGEPEPLAPLVTLPLKEQYLGDTAESLFWKLVRVEEGVGILSSSGTPEPGSHE